MAVAFVPVILSAAKNLSSATCGFFAALRMTGVESKNTLLFHWTEVQLTLNHFERRIIKTEMIQFCKAAGLPLSNIQQLEQPVMGFELDEEYRQAELLLSLQIRFVRLFITHLIVKSEDHPHNCQALTIMWVIWYTDVNVYIIWFLIRGDGDYDGTASITYGPFGSSESASL